MIRRTKAAAAALLMLLCLVVPARAAGAGQFYLAGTADSMYMELEVHLHDSPHGAVEDELTFTTPVNRMTLAGTAYVLPQQEGAWVTVDYLTDPEGDGIYDLAAGEQGRWRDSLTGADRLEPWTQAVPLKQGESLGLSAAALLTGGKDYLARTGQKVDDPCGALLYMVRMWNRDGEECGCVYLRLYEEGLPTLCAGAFRDVEPGSWYYGAVDYVTSRGLMSGTGEGTFSPERKLSRAMLAQILYAIEGKPQVGQGKFSDVAADSWYADAVYWAQEQGIMNGVGDGRFAPDRLLTREQLALILRQYARGTGTEGDGLPQCSDSEDVSPWARTAVEWAVANGLLSVRENGKLEPSGAVTRSEFAAVLRTLDLLMEKN